MVDKSPTDKIPLGRALIYLPDPTRLGTTNSLKIHPEFIRNSY
jgi:hypothetical protein